MYSFAQFYGADSCLPENNSAIRQFPFSGIFFLAVPCGMQDVSSLTRDRTRATAVKAQNPNHSKRRELPFSASLDVDGATVG